MNCNANIKIKQKNQQKLFTIFKCLYKIRYNVEKYQK